MEKPFKPVDLRKVKTYRLLERKSLVSAEDFAKTHLKGGSFKEFLDSIPGILAGKDIRSVITAIACAHEQGNTVLLAMGAHVIKVGLSPVVIDLMQRGIVSAVAMNGAGIIHDLEVALCGKTSEDVAASIENGSFGMVKETSLYLADAARIADEREVGLGEAVGNMILEKKLPQSQLSILAAGAKLNIPVTVHVAFGTDIVHMHPEFDPKLTGAATHMDFRIFASVISNLEGGVFLNVGSAVILPEVFLKALTVARNLGCPLKNITTVNLDFSQNYRPITNVLRRPTSSGGRGYNLIGHHEILLPLIAAGVIEALAG
ncbi:MAG: hypothetical protein JRJ04_07980 [Deltaproteobacteria bacterium]|nr:hypothetical protein [Deltaproteobacteria bacterium]